MVGQPPPPGRLRRVDLKSAQCLGYGTLATCQSFASMAREVVESALRCSAQPPEKKEEFERGVPLRVRVILDADSLRVRVDLEGFGAEADALLGDEGLRALTKFATVSVVTRAGGSLDTTEVLWKGGDLVGSGRSSTCRHSYGSTIILKDVLTNLPVRRRILLGARRERHLAQLRRHMFPAMASNGRVSFDFFCAGKAGRAFGSAPGAGVQRILVDTFGLDPKALAQVSCEARGAAATLCYARDWRNQHQVLFEHLFVNGREADCRAVAGEVKLVASGLFREQGLGTIRDRRRRACFSFVLSVTCARDVRQSEALERVLQRVLASFQSAESEARREEETQKWKSSRAMIPKAGACECCAGGGREAVRLRVDAAFRAGRTGIGVGDIKSLSYLETSIVPASITRGMLDRALCLGQVDNKFVASVCGSTLVLFDQHAADERVRLERFTEILTEDLGSRDRDSSSSVECGPPLRFRPTLEEIHALESYGDRVERWGWRASFSESSNTVSLSWIPCIQGRKLTVQDFRQYLQQLRLTGGSSSMMPDAITYVLGSKACRSALKFGDALSASECEDLVESLAGTRMPFQCAHGRPTCAPLIDLAKLASAERTMTRGTTRGRRFDMERLRSWGAAVNKRRKRV
ncbi:DNA mismatch repair protein Mlh3 [Chloropicon primus]|uniref:DNA mismatch repair protein Mlh3 n=1 Tax=Chloropicon primus TaxID=1764295 RepID=A0A5B8MM51_9CHLO|nr:DNA mismatch repair protein Mlh3 [Chloropicon primus]UPR00740.1 DNA mismatch repair protein Mlh3 [Chloropicon primus]|eukprot:QDZ21529.1 DNA mismatch repair protein Mlh3 [Chloropicon primus]